MSFKNALNKGLAICAPLLWGMVILLYAFRGQLQLFVYPLYIPLLIAAGIALLLFAVIEAMGKAKRSFVALIPLCLSAVLALLITPAPLSAATAQARGVTQTLPQIAAPAAPIFRFALSTDNMELLDWLRVLGGDAEPGRFTGDKMHVTGMVVRQGEEVHVVRMAISCCIADATPVGFPVHFVGDMPTAGSWVAVQGVLALDASDQPFIDKASWSPIPLPKDPYAYL